MSLFSEIVDEILTESVDISTVNDAINHHYEAIIKYKTDGRDDAAGERLIQPVAYGLTKSGYPVVRAFQPYGDTTTRQTAWKFFRLDRIVDWKTLNLHTFSKPPGASREMMLGKFNERGDETMSDVYNIASFGKKKTIEPTTSGPVTKKDVVVNGGEHKREKEENPVTGNRPKDPVAKQDIITANNKTNQIDRLKNKVSDDEYVSQAMNDYEYGPEDNKEENEK